MAEPLLELRNLRKAYGALVVTDDVDLEVAPGELHAVIGPNGAGKTTLIHQISGLAGFLLANQTEFISPAYMTWQRSGELIIMVVLGGLGTLHGAILGAAAFLVVEELLSQVTEHWKMIFGPMLVLIVLFARGGILSLIGGGRRG